MKPSSHNVSDYRPDIDGLRAVAVLAVLMFHAFPAALPGGYVGVDVFFVISGYLISRVILGDLKQGTFTFADFYGRRIRRIFPALVLVLLFVTVCGWYVLMPAEFHQLGRHVTAGAGFVSNFALYGESGYFDVSADLKPLLHLWSLGVEEQYYLVWPLMLFLLRSHAHRIGSMIVAVALGSFLLNVWATPRYSDAAFYLPPTRFWELMMGSIIAYTQVYRSATAAVAAPVGGRSRWSNPLSVAGIALLVAALVLIDDGRAFPGWWALLPTGGTMLLICAGPDAVINRRALSTRLLVYIGLISYPLYLWHWPLLTFARILNGDEEPPVTVRVTALVLSATLAWMTYEFVEKKIRRAKRANWSHRVVPALAVSMVAVGACGLLALTDLAPSRSSSVPHLVAVSSAFEDWVAFNGSRVMEGDSERSVLFLGDSHAAQYMPRIEKLVRDRSAPVRTVLSEVRHGCAPVRRRRLRQLRLQLQLHTVGLGPG